MRYVHAYGLVALLIAALPPGLAQGANTNFAADITVDTYEVAPDPQRFGTNLRDPSELNNFVQDPGFEHTVIRHQYRASGGSSNYILLLPSTPTNTAPGTWHYQTLMDGFFDFATVRVYRVSATGGPLEVVRTGVVTNFVTDGYRRLFVTPLATNRFVDTNVVVGVTNEYQVRAIDTSLNVSTNWSGDFAVTSAPLPGITAAPPVAFWQGTYYQRDTSNPAVPTALSATPLAGAVQLDWATNTESDLAGYIIYRRAGGTNTQWRIELGSDGPAVQAGDYFFIEQTVDDPPVHLLHDRLGTARLVDPWTARFGNAWPYAQTGSVVRDAVELCPTNPGHTSLRIHNPGTYEASIVQGRFSSPEYFGGFYPNLDAGKRYRVDLWLKQSGLTGTVDFALTFHYSNAAASFVATTNWQKHTYTFIAAPLPTNGNISSIVLSFHGPGTLWVDNLVLYEDDDNDPATFPAFALRPAAAQALADYNPGVLRTFNGVCTRNWGVSMDDWTRAEPEMAIQWNVGKRAPDDPYQLPTALDMMRDAGGEPWLIVGSFMDEQEWQDLMEYLAAPYDPTNDSPATKPYAYRRYAQGQAAPWVDEFPRIYLEYGNEMWNGLFEWAFATGDHNGRFAQHFFTSALTNPYVTPAVAAKLRFIVNGAIFGTDAVDGYGHAASRAAPTSHYNAVATYIGGWEAGINLGGTNVNDAGFEDYMLYAPHVIFRAVNQHALSRDTNAAAGYNYNVSLYEGGPGYANPNPGLPFDPVSEVYGKSLAAGIATLDTYLYDSYLRVDPQCFFTFGGQYNWASHGFIANGYHPHTAWLGLQMRNQHASGPMLSTAIHSSPTADVGARTNASGSSLAPAVTDLPLIQPYAFRDGSNYAVFVLSRRLTGDTPVTLRLPFTAVTNGALYKLTGDPRAGNSTSLTIAITSEPVTNFAATYTFIMPPGSAYLFVFQGAETPAPPSQPRVYVSRAVGQTAATTTPSARFLVHFSEPVFGFDTNDVVIGGTAGASHAEMEEAEPRNGMNFIVTITGFATNGTVTVRAPTAAATGIPSGLGNLASIAIDSGVTYTIPPPMNEVLAHEPFDVAPTNAPYPPFLSGVNDGSGWSGPWVAAGFNPTNYGDGYQLADASPLAYSNLYTTGNYARGGRGFESAERGLDLSGSFSTWLADENGTNFIGLSGTELWMSALLRKDAADDAYAAVGLHRGSPGVDPIAGARLVIGYFGGLSNTGGQRRWSLLVRNAADSGFDVVRSSTQVGAGQAVFLVLRMRFGAQDRFDLFVNPVTLGGAPPATADAAWTNSGAVDIVFRELILSGNPATNTFSVDEIRFGDTYAAVTPVSAAGSLQFSSASFDANEGDGLATIYVTRNGGVAGAASIVCEASNGTAMAGIDFTAVTGTLSWVDGDGSTKSLAVPIAGDGVIETNESVNLSLGGAVGATSGTPSVATLTIRESPFNQWRFGRFTASELTNAAISGALADPDGDGAANLQEFAQNLDPAADDAAGLLSAGRELDLNEYYLTATYKRRKSDAGIVYDAAVSTDLQIWLEGAGVAEEWQVTDDGNGLTETAKIRINTPAAVTTSQFLRIRFSLP